MPNTQQMKDHNFLIAAAVAVAGYITAAISWLFASAYGVMFYVLDPEAVKIYGPLLVAVITALIGKGVDVWLRLREERRSRERD